MNTLIIPIGLLCVVAIATSCYADGNELLANCNALFDLANGKNINENYTGMGFCLGMMQGMTNLNKFYEVFLRGDALFCTPLGGITSGQAARIVVKYLKDHPEKLHENESFLAIAALKEAYPCK